MKHVFYRKPAILESATTENHFVRTFKAFIAWFFLFSFFLSQKNITAKSYCRTRNHNQQAIETCPFHLKHNLLIERDTGSGYLIITLQLSGTTTENLCTLSQKRFFFLSSCSQFNLMNFQLRFLDMWISLIPTVTTKLWILWLTA